MGGASGLRARRGAACAAVWSLGLFIAVAGCGKGKPPGEEQAKAPLPVSGGAAPEGPHKKIGVTLLTLQHGFYQQLRKGLESAAQERGYDLMVTSGEFDAARQANQIDEFLVQKVDALVISPCDSRGVGPSIEAANKANIPVFTADIANASGRGTVVSHVASDNVGGGREAADLLSAALSSQGEIAILSHPEVTSVSDRVRGFKERLKEEPGMKIVAELSAEGKRDKAVKVMEDILQAHPKLAGVFAINDDSALGALAAVEAAGKVGDIKIVGYDATEEARVRVDQRKLVGEVAQDPERIGQLTVEAIDDYFHGKTPAAVIPVPVYAYVRSAIVDPESLKSK